MDLGLDEQQEMLKNFARDFLEKECPESLVREMEEDEKGYSPELWQKMAQQGWMGLIIPEEYNGTGMNVCELVVLLEEFGRALVPGPFISTVVLGGVPIMEAGTEEQKQQFLPKIAKTKDVATVAACAYLVGLSQMDFDVTLNYAKERVQFGRPIGSFQAIQHKLADAVIDVDGSRFITYKAAWSLQEGEPDADLMISMAKAWTSDASRRVVAHGQQIHGGIGFTKEYKIQLYFRRQKWMELMWGDADYHRELVAQKLEV